MLGPLTPNTAINTAYTQQLNKYQQQTNNVQQQDAGQKQRLQTTLPADTETAETNNSETRNYNGGESQRRGSLIDVTA